MRILGLLAGIQNPASHMGPCSLCDRWLPPKDAGRGPKERIFLARKNQGHPTQQTHFPPMMSIVK